MPAAPCRCWLPSGSRNASRHGDSPTVWDAWKTWPVCASSCLCWQAQSDPIAGLLITILILNIVGKSAKSVFTRLLDGVDPEAIDEIRHAAGEVKGVEQVSEVRLRWLGHRMYAEVNVAVASTLSIVDA